MTVTVAWTSCLPGSTGVAVSAMARISYGTGPGVAGDSSILRTRPRLAPASPASVAAYSRASANASFSATR